MRKNGLPTIIIARAGIVAGLYVALSMATFSFSSGAIQLRLSEGLTILPLFFPETIVSLFVGCALSNLITGCALFDIIFGSVVSLVAGILTFAVRKITVKWLKVFVGGLFPVLLNAFFLPLIWLWCYQSLEYVYMLQVAFLVISQSISVYGVGTVIYLAIEKRESLFRYVRRDKKEKDNPKEKESPDISSEVEGENESQSWEEKK